MPHVTIDGPIGIDQIEARFEPILYQEGTRVIKMSKLYLEKDRRFALLETVTVEAGHQQKFFVQLAMRDDRLTVRLEPLTDPEKTSAVRIAIALVARRILDWEPGTRYGNTNIAEYLIR